MYSDKNLTCADCGQEFVFTASEQDFYAQRGFTEPRRCPSCRASRKAARNNDSGGSSYGSYGAGGGYSAGGSYSSGGDGGWWWRRRRWIPRSRSPRDVQRHLQQLRPRGPGAVPTDERQARLLLGLLPHHARQLGLLDHPLGAGPARARRTASRPAVETRVVSRNPGRPGDARSAIAQTRPRSVLGRLASRHATKSRRARRGTRTGDGLGTVRRDC